MPEVFATPPEEKKKVAMLNSPSFLGYTGLGSETTASQTDIREVRHNFQVTQ
jgi:isopenicillin N synthase-like dioxygenase